MHLGISKKAGLWNRTSVEDSRLGDRREFGLNFWWRLTDERA
jgi:hypothetical protein